jgi:hypothetical protein
MPMRYAPTPLCRYDTEAAYFDLNVRTAKQAELHQQLVSALKPAYRAQVAARQAACLAGFQKELRAALADGSGSSGFAAAVAECRVKALKEFGQTLQEDVLVEGMHMRLLCVHLKMVGGPTPRGPASHSMIGHSGGRQRHLLGWFFICICYHQLYCSAPCQR